MHKLSSSFNQQSVKNANLKYWNFNLKVAATATKNLFSSRNIVIHKLFINFPISQEKLITILPFCRCCASESIWVAVIFYLLNSYEREELYRLHNVEFFIFSVTTLNTSSAPFPFISSYPLFFPHHTLTRWMKNAKWEHIRATFGSIGKVYCTLYCFMTTFISVCGMFISQQEVRTRSFNILSQACSLIFGTAFGLRKYSAPNFEASNFYDICAISLFIAILFANWEQLLGWMACVFVCAHDTLSHLSHPSFFSCLRFIFKRKSIELWD